MVARLLDSVTMHVDDSLGVEAPPLTQARVTLRLADGHTFERFAEGARGYPERPPSAAEREGKFMGCATRAVSNTDAETALSLLRSLDSVPSVIVSDLTRLLGRAGKLAEAPERLLG